MTEHDSTEMEIYSGADDRPEFLIRFPVDVTAEQVAEFEEHYLAARARRSPSRVAPIDVSWLTTEPAKPVWPVWLGIAVVGGIPLAVMLCVVAIAVLVKP